MSVINEEMASLAAEFSSAYTKAALEVGVTLTPDDAFLAGFVLSRVFFDSACGEYIVDVIEDLVAAQAALQKEGYREHRGRKGM